MARGTVTGGGPALVSATARSHRVTRRLPRALSPGPENDYFEEEIRHLLYGRRRGVYRILFTIQEETVFVLAVHHGARQPLRPEDLEPEDDAT